MFSVPNPNREEEGSMNNSIIRVIQKQVPLGSIVTFFLANGREITGSLIELSYDYVTIQDDNNKTTTIREEMIGAWEVFGEKPGVPEGGRGQDLEPEVIKRPGLSPKIYDFFWGKS
jgi:hypothetical protein